MYDMYIEKNLYRLLFVILNISIKMVIFSIHFQNAINTHTHTTWVESITTNPIKYETLFELKESKSD